MMNPWYGYIVVVQTMTFGLDDSFVVQTKGFSEFKSNQRKRVSDRKKALEGGLSLRETE